VTDMRLPIQLALTYPDRKPSALTRLDLAKIRQLNFRDADMEKFPCLELAYKAGRIGGTMPTVVSGADEVAVSAFLENRTDFMDIPEVIRQTMDMHQKDNFVSEPSLDDIVMADKWARNFAEHIILSKLSLSKESEAK